MTSDTCACPDGAAHAGGAQGLSAFLGQTLAWVQHQRCVWHLWRNLGGPLAHTAAQVAQAAVGEVAEAIRDQVRAELVALIHAVIDAQSYAQAEAALVILRSHPQGAAIAQFLNEHLDHILVHLVAYYAGLHPSRRSGIGGISASA